ncbi:hypothetical protein [Photobacterium leiognathi]|uniref:hypothetical protein n=1 Tax=Photobacterium leiognathi TaxID=553611 RepID=UPI00298169FF|nr:hypothetical protein [Photobacterium leiognathi]
MSSFHIDHILPESLVSNLTELEKVKSLLKLGSKFDIHGYENLLPCITKTFWWGLGLSILGALLAFVFVGYLLLLAVWIWSIFRVVKGLAKLTSNKGYNG